jgi:prephenate dehydrogenase
VGAKTFGSIAIIGTGLIGGSVGLAALKRGVTTEVVGHDVRSDRLSAALSNGAITRAAESASTAASGCDLVVLAAPVGSIAGVFAEIAGDVAPDAIVTDVGSTKVSLLSEIERLRLNEICFIGGHPLAGTEEEGVEASSADMFDGAVWLLTPSPGTDRERLHRLESFVKALGASPLVLDPLQHDEIVAVTSHLPQVLASALVGFAAQRTAENDLLPKLAAGGFRDTTRIAASSPELWIDILRQNKEPVLSVLEGFDAHLDRIRTLIQVENWHELLGLLTQARDARARLPKKPGVAPGELVELAVPVSDRPRVLAEITTIVGDAGVNVEDLQIAHTPGGQGTIHLFVKGDSEAMIAEKTLTGAGFEVHRPG